MNWFHVSRFLLFFFLGSCSGSEDSSLSSSLNQSEVTSDDSRLLTETLSHDGILRTYILYVPSRHVTSTSVPLMLNFHGYGMTASDQLKRADMTSLAESEGFLLIYPEGTPLYGEPHWNAGLDRPENKSSADDFGFVEALIEKMVSKYNIDSQRVYACGYSNGSFFTYALACYHSDKIAAIASVSGTMMEETYENCNPTHPTSMINIHGTSDYVVPYQGGTGLASIDQVMRYWVDYNQTTSTPVVNEVTEDGVTMEHSVYSHGQGQSSVEHLKILGGGHDWFQITYQGTDVNGLIWNFVSRYPKEGLRTP